MSSISVGGAGLPSGDGVELPPSRDGSSTLAVGGAAPGGGVCAGLADDVGPVRGGIGPTLECGVPTAGAGGVGATAAGGDPPPDGGIGPEPGGDAGPPPEGGPPPDGASLPDAGHPRGCQPCGGRCPPPADVSSDGAPNRAETTTGIRPCAKFAGFPGSDARTTSLVAPSFPACTSNVLPNASAVAVAGSRLVRTVNEYPLAPSKYESSSTRLLAPGAISIEGANPENRGAVGVESLPMMSVAPADQVDECPPVHPSAATARCRLNLPAYRVNSCTASWSATARAWRRLRSEPCRSVRLDRASSSPVRS